MTLAAGSPALGAGSAAVCAAIGAADERGFPRPGDMARSCDIGAYELLPPVATSTGLGSSQPRTVAGEAVTLTASVTIARVLPPAVPSPAGVVEFSDGGVLLATVALDGGGRAALTSTALAPGTHRISATYRGDGIHASSSSTVLEQSVAPPAPALAALTQSHRRWREGKRLAAIASRLRRPPVGTTFSFRLSTPAAVTLTFERSLPGRRAGRRCVRARRSPLRRSRCVRSVVAGRLTLASAHAGAGRIAFQGRLTRRTRLAPGSYVLLLSARNVTGAAAPIRIAFTIAPG
jgi:hypothetical protein